MSTATAGATSGPRPADALASTANYLSRSGWRTGHTWGYEVVLPASFEPRKKGDRALGDWQKLGITRPGGQAFPRPGDRASLYLPAGREGPAFLLLANFQVIKRYNASNSYALAVGPSRRPAARRRRFCGRLARA
ncbi:MAG: lytic murein transglycosylase [Hyphomicrobium sp.]